MEDSRCAENSQESLEGIAGRQLFAEFVVSGVGIEADECPNAHACKEGHEGDDLEPPDFEVLEEAD